MLVMDTDSKGQWRAPRIADWTMIAARFSLVIVLSVLMRRDRSHRRQAVNGHWFLRHDAGEGMLQGMRRWYYDEELDG